ncbi:MAG: NUDIX domain-containing protein [bacterium]|nr:NUDIX domain-containing protein [bacterium]
MIKGIDYIGICVNYICHDGNGRIVLNKRGKNSRDEVGRWDCGGGSLDFGATVDETLKKEIKEEYATDVISFEFLGYRDVFRELDGKKTHWLAIDFMVLLDPAQVKNAEPHKFDAVEWFTLATLPSPLHFGFSQMLEKYSKKVNELSEK